MPKPKHAISTPVDVYEQKASKHLHKIMKSLTEVQTELQYIQHEADPRHMDKFNTEWVQIHLDAVQVKLNKIRAAKRKRNRIVLSE